MNNVLKHLLLVLLVVGPACAAVFVKKYRVSFSIQSRKQKPRPPSQWDMKDLHIGHGGPMSREKKIMISFENLYPQTSQRNSCLDAALAGMRVGGKRRVVFPAVSGASPGRGPTKVEAPLVYNLELL